MSYRRLKKYILLVSCLSTLLSSLFAQSVLLTGQVSIHNSAYTTGQIAYVKNTYVSAPFAGSANTDNTGSFQLNFVGIDRGATVALTVEKDGWEVVNTREINNVVLGRRTPLRVYLARRGDIARAQTELYNVSLKALTRRHDELIAHLRADQEARAAVIADLESKLNREITDRFEAERILTEQLEATRNRLPEFALELATVNLDFASEMYRQAYTYFKAGEIERAIETLDEAILDKAAAEVVANLDSLNQSIAHLDTVARLEEERFDLQLQSLLVLGRSLEGQAQSDSARSVYLRTLGLIEQHRPNTSLQADLYRRIGKIDQHRGQLDTALFYQEASLNIYKELPEQDSIILVALYDTLASLYSLTKQPEKEIDRRMVAFEIQQKRLPPGDSDLVGRESKLIRLLFQQAARSEQAGIDAVALRYYRQLLNINLARKEYKTVTRMIRRLEKRL